MKADDFAYRTNEKSLRDLELKMRNECVTITEIDTNPFVEATKGVYEKLGYTELRTHVQEIINQ